MSPAQFCLEQKILNFKYSTFIQVPFLNLMANIKQRAGSVHIRVGGNTQETATLVASIPGGKAIGKDKGSATNPTQTPALIFTAEILYMLGNISALTNVKWYLGVPFNDTTNPRLQIAEVGEAVLGSNLLGLQLSNEPDLYSACVLFSYDCSLPFRSPFFFFLTAMDIDPPPMVRLITLGSSVSWYKP